jgi:hypothetical protein
MVRPETEDLEADMEIDCAFVTSMILTAPLDEDLSHAGNMRRIARTMMKSAEFLI